MTTKPAGARRRKTSSSYRKLAVSMPETLARAVEDEVHARHAASFSAFVSAAVEAKLERDRLQGLLDEAWSAKPMTPKERAWADKLLRA